MNRHLLKRQLTSYGEDYAAWCAEQGALLREGRLADLDRENLAEEIESLGRSDRKEIRNRLEVLVRHLLKWQLQPHKRKAGWQLTILEQRRQISALTEESPSLKNVPTEVLSWSYDLARLKAAAETGLRKAVLPVECPFSIEQILDESFLPE
ncbi:DUF29 domain-containing protein [Pseudaminobacter sp. 19-2017]|uniref:DUF29 domain-containing protein n=2 Tax=Pseudaminobacter soli (ex Zhang et al. 2022) TaxID=2831468 RepID=A0A942E1F5_9HYPH|nr:DUF29 domain-containing protein [Pseudaminobacter soli]